MNRNRTLECLALTVLGLFATACGTPGGADQRRTDGARGMSNRASGPAAVPVRMARVERRAIASYLETNGVLEAEHDVDVVARTAGPIVALAAEEGERVEAGALLARIDDREAKTGLDVAAVNHDDAKRAFERTASSFEQGLVSREDYDAAVSKLKATEAELEAANLTLDYTRIRAPFAAIVVKRYVKLAENVSVGTPLFRVSNFTPLLCPIEIPEKELSRLRLGQPATIEVEAYGEERFPARVLRISPVVDASTGTVTVTLETEAGGRLRPGMFANVALETDRHQRALVIPSSALVLDSIGDTVFVRQGDTAHHRDLELGFREGDSVEVLDGLEEGEEVVVLGQDALSDGAPITILASGEATAPRPPAPDGGTGAGRPDGVPPRMLERIRSASPEELEQIRARLRERGLDEDEVEAVVRRARSGSR